MKTEKQAQQICRISAIESRIRWNRQRMFDLSDAEQERAGAEIDALKSELAGLRSKQAEKTGPYSGLAKRELAASGTCEADWF